MSANRVTHFLLKEVNGHRYLLCDTKGYNLHSTAAFHSILTWNRCRRCEQRWNALAERAHDNHMLRQFLQIELTDKIELGKINERLPETH